MARTPSTVGGQYLSLQALLTLIGSTGASCRVPATQGDPVWLSTSAADGRPVPLDDSAADGDAKTRSLFKEPSARSSAGTMYQLMWR